MSDGRARFGVDAKQDSYFQPSAGVGSAFPWTDIPSISFVANEISPVTVAPSQKGQAQPAGLKIEPAIFGDRFIQGFPLPSDRVMTPLNWVLVESVAV